MLRWQILHLRNLPKNLVLKSRRIIEAVVSHEDYNVAKPGSHSV